MLSTMVWSSASPSSRRLREFLKAGAGQTGEVDDLTGGCRDCRSTRVLPLRPSTRPVGAADSVGAGALNCVSRRRRSRPRLLNALLNPAAVRSNSATCLMAASWFCCRRLSVPPPVDPPPATYRARRFDFRTSLSPAESSVRPIDAGPDADTVKVMIQVDHLSKRYDT